MCNQSNANSLRMFCSLLQNGKIISIVKGANAPLLNKKIAELVLEERAIASGQKERTMVLTNQILK